MELVGTPIFAHDIYEKVQNDEIVFDFSQMRNFYPLPMLIMGATMCNYRMQYPEIPFRIDGCEGKVGIGMRSKDAVIRYRKINIEG